MPSPQTTPKKAQPYSSPAASPVRSQDGDVGMDWQPDFGFAAETTAGGATIMLTERDTKTEVRF